MISSVHQQLAAVTDIQNTGGGLLLHTCQRVEVYRAARPPVKELGLVPAVSARTVVGEAAARRLTEIAAGVRSELLGERFVLGQVEAAGRRLPATHPLKALVAESVSIARWLRVEHGFAAAVDYPGLAFSLLTTDPPTRRTPALLVVGGGALARAVAADALAAGYRDTVMVTRSPKRLRKRLTPEIRARVSVCTPEHAGKQLAGSPWDAVVATTNLVEPYRLQVAALLDDRGCESAVDLSGLPVHEHTSDRYEHMYGQRFARAIARQNEVISDRAEQVRQAIADLYREL
ncbi:hypothetical protein [Nocardia sp. NBC_01388]|uniref:hypothetical protein n=1 Tax=Nocardia sp. NBC_01388 TaxID=2903596 RepID=UPI002F919102